jgi:hypothetical protein
MSLAGAQMLRPQQSPSTLEYNSRATETMSRGFFDPPHMGQGGGAIAPSAESSPTRPSASTICNTQCPLIVFSAFLPLDGQLIEGDLAERLFSAAGVPEVAK